MSEKNNEPEDRNTVPYIPLATKSGKTKWIQVTWDIVDVMRQHDENREKYQQLRNQLRREIAEGKWDNNEVV